LKSHIPIFTFHALDNGASPIASSPRAFVSGLQTLNDKGFHTIGLCEVAQCIARKLPFPAHSVVLTFDDGYASVYDTAFPLLQKYGMTATVFLRANAETTRFANVPFPSMNGRAMLSWRQVRELCHYGIEIGAHTLSHPDLTRLAVSQARDEIVRSKEIIQDILGAPVTSFAYPFGRYNQAAYEIVQENFECACTDRLEFVHRHSDVHLMGRIDSYYLRNPTWYNLVPSGLFALYVQARAIPRNLRRSVMWSPHH
jgi:peptidoglycan/xylan/chitin deacetylase (PgdA/CDA1 family)